MVLSLQHERLKHTLATVVELIAAERGIDIEGVGSTPFWWADVARGFEPDTCFYFQHAARMRTRDEIDLAVNPVPELVIEIDIANPSLNKLPLFAALGVTEVWRYDGHQLTIRVWQDGAYRAQPESRLLAGITDAQLLQLTQSSRVLTHTTWIEQV